MNAIARLWCWLEAHLPDWTCDLGTCDDDTPTPSKESAA